MTKITVSEDCGNAPKKALLRDANIAFAEGDADFVLENVADDIEWTIVGDRVIRGTDDFAEALDQMKGDKTVELVLDNVITHGRTAAVDGTLTLESGKAYAFCDVYAFGSHGKNARIQTMTSYAIEVDDRNPDETEKPS